MPCSFCSVMCSRYHTPYTPNSLTNQHLCNSTDSTSEQILDGAVTAFSFNLFYCVGHGFWFRIGQLKREEGKPEMVALQIVKVTRRRCWTPFSTPWSAVPSPSVRRLRAHALLARDFFVTHFYISCSARAIHILALIPQQELDVSTCCAVRVLEVIELCSCFTPGLPSLEHNIKQP